jgi:hypothetical protein
MKGQANRLTGIRTRGSPGPDEVAPVIWGMDVFVSRRSGSQLEDRTRAAVGGLAYWGGPTDDISWRQ